MANYPAGRNQTKNALLLGPDQIRTDEALDRESIARNNKTVVPHVGVNVNFKNFKVFDPWKHLRLDEEGYKTPSILIYAPRGGGKTHIMKWLLYLLHAKGKKNHYDEAFLFSNTAKLQPDTYDFLPSNNVYQGFDDKAIQAIFDKQAMDIAQKRKVQSESKKNTKKGLSGGSEKAHDPKFKKIAIILDDVINDPKVRHSETLNRLYTQGRHIMISPIMISQEIGGLGSFPPVIRTNTDLVLAFCAGNERDRELITQRYLSKINKKVGEEILNGLTSEMYTACAIHYGIYANARAYEDYVYRFRAPPKIPDFFIGRKLETNAAGTKAAATGLVKFNINTENNGLGGMLDTGLQYFGNYILGTD